jgi:Ino eighty subunit 1
MATVAPDKEEQDPRISLQHVLDPDVHETTAPATKVSEGSEEHEPPEDADIKTEDSNENLVGTPLKGDPDGASDTATPQYTSTTTTIRRNANGSVSSVYSGNKIRHLKKEDGVPLWRKDIQYDFLKYVFEDEKLVFHKASDGSFGHTFADIYLDAMAKSSKCSKILKEKLLSDRPAAVNMAMVCLLVNVGRMNTTLNCKCARQCILYGY